MPSPIEELSENTKQRWKEYHRRKGQQFIAAIPLSWIGQTFQLSPNTTRVALAIWFQAKRSRSDTVALGASLLEQFGVGRKASYRALCELETAGVISVDRSRGRSPRVTILEQKG